MNAVKVIILLHGIARLARADFSNDGVPVSPDILPRIIAGAERSGDPLQSKAIKGEDTIYYLRRAEYIGECVAPFGTVHIAQLFYVRSGIRGQQTPPPRGHSFLVFYDSDFRVHGYWRDPGGPYEVNGSKLLFDGKVIFDYANPSKHTAFPPGQWPHPPTWEQSQRQHDDTVTPIDRPKIK